VDYFISSLLYENIAVVDSVFERSRSVCRYSNMRSQQFSEQLVLMESLSALTEPSESQLAYRETRNGLSCKTKSSIFKEMGTISHWMRLWEDSGDLFSERARYSPMRHASFHCSRIGSETAQSVSRMTSNKICAKLAAGAYNLSRYDFSWWKRNYISGIYGVLQMPMKMHPKFDSAIIEVHMCSLLIVIGYHVVLLFRFCVVTPLASYLCFVRRNMKINSRCCRRVIFHRTVSLTSFQLLKKAIFHKRLRHALLREDVNPYGVMLVNEVCSRMRIIFGQYFHCAHVIISNRGECMRHGYVVGSFRCSWTPSPSVEECRCGTPRTAECLLSPLHSCRLGCTYISFLFLIF
jgi:hypothetical protein